VGVLGVAVAAATGTAFETGGGATAGFARGAICTLIRFVAPALGGFTRFAENSGNDDASWATTAAGETLESSSTAAAIHEIGFILKDCLVIFCSYCTSTYDFAHHTPLDCVKTNQICLNPRPFTLDILERYIFILLFSAPYEKTCSKVKFFWNRLIQAQFLPESEGHIATYRSDAGM
jgi:hypothetical protein